MTKNERKEIKDYVYYDDKEVSSIIAQLKDGYPSLMKRTIAATAGLTDTTKESKGRNYKGKGSVGFASGGYDNIKRTSSEKSNSKDNTYQKAIESIYEDYALNIIENELNAQIKDITQSPEEGTIVKYDSKFSILDLSPMNLLFNNNKGMEFIKAFMGENDDEEQSELTVELTGKGISLLNSLFPNSDIVSANDSFLILKEDMLRLNHSQLQMLNLSKRNITIVGRVESIISENELDENKIDENNMAKMTSVMSILALKGIIGLKKGDRFIKPIALYFT